MNKAIIILLTAMASLAPAADKDAEIKKLRSEIAETEKQISQLRSKISDLQARLGKLAPPRPGNPASSTSAFRETAGETRRFPTSRQS